MKEDPIQYFLETLDEAYHRQAWHGPNLRGALRGVKAEEAAWRPGPGRHNIWEIAVHAAYWKYAVRRRITGEKRGSFPHPGSNWFPRPVEMSDKSWREDLQLLRQQHQQLKDTVAGLKESHLHRKSPGSRFTYLTLIRGIAFHDVYHAGQIQILKKLYQERHG